MYTFLNLLWEEQKKEIVCVCCVECVGEFTVYVDYMTEQTDQRNTCDEGKKIGNCCSNWHVGL